MKWSTSKKDNLALPLSNRTNNGQSGGAYLTLASTNLTLPLNQWTPVATNSLSAYGDFTITATNAVNPNAPQQFLFWNYKTKG